MEFLDTNILVYAVSQRIEDEEKSKIARQLLVLPERCISLQVLQEFYNVARNPKKLSLSHEQARNYCQHWLCLTVLEPTLRMFDEALRLCNRYQISYYDAAIIAAAKTLGCTLIYSEDLNDGQDYDGVRVMNPFQNLAFPRSP